MGPYYERRAAEYDDRYLGAGLFASRDRPGWDEELRALQGALASLRPVRTLDVACGTGFLTRLLPGAVVGSDASHGMLAESRARHGHPLVRADAFALPFRDSSFDQVFTGHFFGRLYPDQRAGSSPRPGGSRRSSWCWTRRSATTWCPSRSRTGS